MANTFLTKTFASDSNRKTWTWSAWIKRSGLGGTQTLMTQIDGWNGNGNAGFYIIGDQLTSYNFTSSLNAGTSSYNRPSMFLRDVNGWYHTVVRLDTTQSTASDRCRWYVNGEQLTDFAYANYPSLNQDCNFNGGDPHGIGSHTAGANYFNGVMSYINFSDGYSYAPTVFGSTDSTTGEWTINTNPIFTLGTHGFTILKNGNTITDQSTNSNNWGLGGGTLTKTEDSPSNVFATLNPLNVPTSNAPTFSNGNNTSITSTSGSGKWGGSTTLGMTSGKFYCEAKATVDNTNSRNVIGITGDSANMARGNGSPFGSDQTSSGYYSGSGEVTYNNSAQYTASTYTTGDIIQVAIDLDNNRLFYGKNGTWQNSANPTTSTGAITIASANTSNDGAYFFCQADDTGSSSPSKFEFNFGNGYFGTTAISSAGANASGIGIFEYDVPTGYTALSTKGLNL